VPEHLAISSHIKRAYELIKSVKGKTLPPEERKELAIEIAEMILNEANRIRTSKEKRLQLQLARMMNDPKGKIFTTAMTDQCFRTPSSKRAVDQILFLLKKYGIPKYFDILKKTELRLFQIVAKPFYFAVAPLVVNALRKETSSVILPGEEEKLVKHIKERTHQGLRLNINHLGEAILGEKEAKTRLDAYLYDLKQPHIEYVSIKISTIYSQINLIAWEKSIEKISERLRLLYREAMKNEYIKPDGKRIAKFANLDMEEYRDLHLTKDVFKKVLSEDEFMNFYAGIVLQAYLPDSFDIQRELTEWAKERMRKGGAPIKIRLVKGANLAMEQVEASLRHWHQAPYRTKAEVDANYKRMLEYGCQVENADAVRLGIGSHNLFDISLALVFRSEKGIEDKITFEMLEGMAEHIRRVIQRLSQDMLLYCPVAKKEEFQSAVAYLIRRLDENTGPENFLRDTFDLTPKSGTWDRQARRFSNACDAMHAVKKEPQRLQNRFDAAPKTSLEDPFHNEADTDFSLGINRQWLKEIASKWHEKPFENIPLVIGGREIHQDDPQGKGEDPSTPNHILYRYSYATVEQVDEALKVAKNYEKTWSALPVRQRAEHLLEAARKLRENRGELLGVKLFDGGKSLIESDPEVSEAIDFAEYYARSLLELHSHSEISWRAKGTVLVAPPWNFPVAIPCGGILAALAAGNCVIFKPAPEAVLSGWVLAKTLWSAGIPKEALQFISCEDEPVGTKLIQDERVNAIILTGATETALLFHKLRPGIDLSAETGGKNALIITSLSDRDLAIKDLLHSAFGHSGQKCSAASLAILEAKVYDDPHFRAHLKDAAESLTVAAAWDPSAKVVPLIRPAHSHLLKGLTTLEEGEEWLVEPKQDPHNPNLWSPGIKWGVKKGSFMHKTELFGPVLGVMRAKNLKEALELANGTRYGLTSGIHSLDEREIAYWLQHIEAGNLYINRGITGAIVQRQPFGGCKASNFGHGSKAGGPNYLMQFMLPCQAALPNEIAAEHPDIEQISAIISRMNLNEEEKKIWKASIGSYIEWSEFYHRKHDPSLLLGQDNFLCYKAHTRFAIRIQKNNSPLDILRVIAAARLCQCTIDLSTSRGDLPFDLRDLSNITVIEESEEKFCRRLAEGRYAKVRLISPPSPELIKAASVTGAYLNQFPVLASGRVELLNYLREIAISHDYHRYGNLGDREGEKRAPIP
jgi:RHH-type transcriptional regulator, proline utilization regulon repressor / proline dehydrogenase / delta 1-pyrroline-5-carboxylate dehydrogenase